MFCPVWPWNLMDDLENNRTTFQCYFKLCASFRSHWWIQTGVTVRIRLSWVLTSATLTFDLRPWLFAWTSLLSLVITPENFMMIWWWEHSQQERLKGRNTLGCLDQYAAQNSKYARPPIPSQPPTQKVFFQWHTQYDPTMKHSHCETVYACSNGCSLNWFTPSEFFKFSQLTD